MKFYELEVGAEFTAWQRRYRKVAMSMAQSLDEGEQRGWGFVFLAEIEVESEGPLLPPEVAARWKPDRGPWAAVIDSLVSAYPSTGRNPPDVSRDQD